MLLSKDEASKRLASAMIRQNQDDYIEACKKKREDIEQEYKVYYGEICMHYYDYNTSNIRKDKRWS